MRAVLEHAVGADLASQFAVFAGDVVPAKKPDPAIYQLALRELGREASDAVVVEDSGNGLAAATISVVVKTIARRRSSTTPTASPPDPRWISPP